MEGLGREMLDQSEGVLCRGVAAVGGAGLDWTQGNKEGQPWDDHCALNCAPEGHGPLADMGCVGEMGFVSDVVEFEGPLHIPCGVLYCHWVEDMRTWQESGSMFRVLSLHRGGIRPAPGVSDLGVHSVGARPKL